MTAGYILNSSLGLYHLFLRKPNRIDLSSKIVTLITDQYCQDATPFSQTLRLMTDLRNESLLMVDEDPFIFIDLEVITKLKRFIELLNLIIAVFDDDILEFQWTVEHDCHRIRSLRQERLILLEQLAAYYTVLAVKEMKDFEDAENIETEHREQLRKAGIHFQYAAGCLSLVQNDDEDNEKTINLMLAQAQEVYFLSAEMEDFQITVLVKLAMQTSLFFRKCASDDIELAVSKSTYYQCIAYELYASNCKGKKRYGEASAYLYEASKLLETIGEHSICAKILQSVENLKLKINDSIESIKRDRKVELPEFNSFPPLPCAVMVKALRPRDFEDDEPNVFKKLVPLPVIELIKDYSLQLDDFARFEVVDPLSVLNKNVEEFKIYREILNHYTNEQDNRIPENINEFRIKILDMGNKTRMNDLFNAVNNLKLRCRQTLDDVWTNLKEQTDYEESLAGIGGIEKWPLGKIEDDSTGSVLFNTFKIYENYIKQSEEGDNLIALQVNELNPFLIIYESIDQLREYIPPPQYLEMNPQFKAIVGKLDEALLEMESMIEKREAFVQKVETKVGKCQYVEKCIKNIRSRFDEYDANDIAVATMKDEIMKFEKELDFVKEQQKAQSVVIDQFKILRNEFNNQKEKLVVSQKRLESIKVLTSIYESYLECMKNLNQGIDFYQNLFDNILVKQVQAEQFLCKRSEKVKTLLGGDIKVKGQ